MSKIRNAVYGLALGDAFGFITERMRFPEIVRKYGNGQYLPVDKTLQVSDDTQMSIVMINSMRRYFGDNKNTPYTSNIKYTLMNDFIDWMASGEPRGAGKATINSLRELKKDRSDPHAYGSLESKGSGTVMRAPWVGLCDFIEDKTLENFSWQHSRITHNSATTTYSAYLTSLITRRLFDETIQCGEIRDFALEALDSIGQRRVLTEAEIHGIDEIAGFIHRINRLPQNWASLSLDVEDVCAYTGTAGRGDMVLAGAIAIADAYGDHDPIQGLHRSMMTDGDSDTIGALVGAFIGASHEDDIWEDLPEVLEDEYVKRLERVIHYIEL